MGCKSRAWARSYSGASIARLGTDMALGKVTVLAYHRIDIPGRATTHDLSPELIDAYPADFEAQMRWVASRYNVISGLQLVETLRHGKPLPPRALMITFDDGYNCFMET